MSDTINALEEFRKAISWGDSPILAAKISFEDPDDGEKCVLHVGHTRREYELLERFLDREYNSGYGMQYLFGTLWFRDGSWAIRGEYDGSEWWEYCTRPEPPTRSRCVNAMYPPPPYD